MSAGVTAVYNYVPPIRDISTNIVISSDGVNNPADNAPYTLRNIRGKLRITITTSDNSAGISSSFVVNGGYGEWQGQQSQNFYYVRLSNVNCTITELGINRIQVDTVAPAAIRTYIFTFYPLQSVPPTVEQTSLNLLATNDLTVKIEKQDVWAR